MEIRKVTGYRMECPECFGKFNELEQKPKALPCGHTFCLKCLESVDRCFVDNKEFSSLPHELPDNQNIKAMVRSNVTQSGGTVHVWCSDCNTPAKELCIVRQHKITSKKNVLFQKLLQKLKIKENPIHPQNCQEYVENLTEVETAEAIQILEGRIAPTSILFRGGTRRWIAELLPKDFTEDSVEAKTLLSMLFLMRQKGILPKEILMQPQDEKPDEVPAVDPECVLDLTNLSSCRDQTHHSAEKEDFLISNRLLKVRRLFGLYCDRDKQWTVKLLENLAPVLEELHIYNFHLQHLEKVLVMPELRWLVLEDTKIPPKEIFELPPLQHESKVEFLWLNLIDRRYNDNICKNIIKLYQASVKILFVTVPSYHVHAVEMFDDLELPNLQLLMYGNPYCGSDNCRDVMTGIRKKFPQSQIICMLCERMNNFDDE